MGSRLGREIAHHAALHQVFVRERPLASEDPPDRSKFEIYADEDGKYTIRVRWACGQSCCPRLSRPPAASIPTTDSMASTPSCTTASSASTTTRI